MLLSVSDVLLLDVFIDAKIVAGRRGLKNEVYHVTVGDGPLLRDDLNSFLLKKGDFYLTSLFHFKNDDERLLALIKILVKAQAAGMCVSNLYFEDFSDSVKEYCNINNFPVIFIDWKVPYSKLIEAITKVLYLDNKQDNKEKILQIVLEDTISSKKRQQYLEYLIPDFKNINELFCIYIRSATNNFIDRDIENKYDDNIDNLIAFKYKMGYLFYVYTSTKFDDTSNILKYIIDAFCENISEYRIGVSDIVANNSTEDKMMFETVSHQALIASQVFLKSNQKVSFYRNLGVFKVLIPLRFSRELEMFVQETLLPIIKYDQEKNNDLYITLQSFIKSGRNYKECAKELYIHENTVRYRLKKTYEILDLELSENEILEDISLCFKILEAKRVDAL